MTETSLQNSVAKFLGTDGEPCPSCQAPLASDQRYCLNCGRPRGADRVPYRTLLAGHGADDVVEAETPPPPKKPRVPPAAGAAAAGAAGAVLLGLGVLGGALIANGGDDAPAPVAQAPAQKAPVVNITNAGGGGTADAASAEFTSDWPDGKSGYTVQLATVPNDSGDATAVNQAKTDATGKGAKDVGAFDSADYPSAGDGVYVVYSGVYTGKGAKAKAAKALKGLKKDFSDAKVVKVAPDAAAAGAEGTKPEEKAQTVSKDALKDLESSTGADQQKKSAKLPDTVKLPGKTPAKDNKAPNGGKGGEDIQ